MVRLPNDIALVRIAVVGRLFLLVSQGLTVEEELVARALACDRGGRAVVIRSSDIARVLEEVASVMISAVLSAATLMAC